MSCSVNGCANPLHAKGLCSIHYKRIKRHGNAIAVKTPDGDLLRFINEVATPHKSVDCLIWPYTKNSKGYGQLWVDGKMVLAHRYVCKIAHGDPAVEGHQAAHKCGNRLCVNPNHLSWKTPAENQADKITHGTDGRGERNSQSKLTEKQAREIIRLKGVKSQREIASRFGVSQKTISKIHTGYSWGWL